GSMEAPRGREGWKSGAQPTGSEGSSCESSGGGSLVEGVCPTYTIPSGMVMKLTTTGVPAGIHQRLSPSCCQCCSGWRPLLFDPVGDVLLVKVPLLNSC